MEISVAEARNLEAFAATARAATRAAALLAELHSLAEQLQVVAVNGAQRSDRTHRQIVALTGWVSRRGEECGGQAA